LKPQEKQGLIAPQAAGKVQNASRKTIPMEESQKRRPPKIYESAKNGSASFSWHQENDLRLQLLQVNGYFPHRGVQLDPDNIRPQGWSETLAFS